MPGPAPRARLAVATGLVLVLATGCAASPAPDPSDPGPDARVPWLVLSTSQALPPADLWAHAPTLVVTGDGVLVTPGAVPAIYPGPLVTPLVGRQVSSEGRARIVRLLGDAGLLDGTSDFTGGRLLPGGVTGRIELLVDGAPVAITGLPDLPPMGAEPGSPEAFAAAWQRLLDLPSWLGQELGPESPHRPASYAILVGPPPVGDAGIVPQLAAWPLTGNLAAFGRPVGGGGRCGIVSGEDADLLRPALEAANQLTHWVSEDDPDRAYGLAVQPLVTVDDPCARLPGAG